LAGGLIFGSLLAVYGLRQTRFEQTPQGLFYTPHAHLGIALSLLFVGRILYRLVAVYALNGAASPGAAEFARSPLTLAVFGLLAGYYIIYAVGLVRWRNRVLREETARG
jgi:cytochrome b561